MNFFTYRISLDIRETTSQAFINVKKNDTARKFIFTLTDNGRAYQITEGCTAVFRAKKPDGTILYNNCPIVGNAMEYYLTSQTVAAVGIVECEITLYGSNSKQITSPRFSLAVDDVLYSDSEVESKDEFTALTGAIDEVRASKAFTIKLTTTNDGITADKTFTEIAEKVNAAKSVIVNMDGWAFPVSYSADSGKIVFSSLWANIAEIPNAVTFAVNSSNVWNVVVSDIPTTAQVSAKYTKPASGIPKVDLANDVQASLDKADTALQEHQSLTAYRTSADQDVIDGSKQDKLIAGENITIAEDGKTISATGGVSNAIGYFEVTLTERGEGLYTGSKTFAQVKAEIENNNRFMFIDGYDCVFIVTRVGNAFIEFAGMLDGTDGWLWVGVASDERWEVVPEVRITLDWYNALADDIGKLRNLTTTDKTSLVAAVNEVKGIADNKQAKLIAGENITISEDGKTISATGGGGSTIELDTTLSETGKAADAKAVGDALSDKQDTISDLATIRSGAAKGATALQSVPSTYRTASAQDVVDNGLDDRISAIEGKEAGWNGKYSKPTGGIPKADLATAVQASLGKADSALQEHQSLAAYRTAAAQDNIDSTKQDKLIAGENITIAEDGKTISATGGGVLPVTLTLGAPIQQGNRIGWFYTADQGKYEIKDAIDAGITVLKCSLIYEDSPNEVAKVIYLNFSSMDSDAIYVGFYLPGEYYELSFPISGAGEGMLKYITLPTKTSELENDSGFLTLDTLPKYEGVVE